MMMSFKQWEIKINPRIKLNHNSYNNIVKGRGKTKGSRIFQGVSRFLSKIVACQQQIQRATMVYRSLHGLAPNYLSSKFERREVAYNLRDSENKLNVPLPRTNYYKNSFSYSGAILWNSLPCNLREAESLGQFKRLLKEL